LNHIWKELIGTLSTLQLVPVSVAKKSEPSTKDTERLAGMKSVPVGVARSIRNATGSEQMAIFIYLEHG